MTTIDPGNTTILKLLARGRDPHWVAEATGTKATEVEEVGRRYGWPDVAQLRANLEAADVQDTAPAHTPTPGPRPVVNLDQPRPSRPSVPTAPNPTAGIAAAPGTGKLELLLARAGKHDTAPIRAARNAVLSACTRLEGALQKQENKAREKSARDAEKAAARSRVQMLEKQLREARAALRGETTTTSGTAAGPTSTTHGGETQGARIARRVAALGVSSRTIRAWAKENDVPVPDTGALPNSTIDAWEKAHPGQVTA